MMFADDKLICVLGTFMLKKDEVRKMFPKHGETKELEILDDYTDLIDSQVGALNTKLISGLLGEIDRQAGKWIPDDHEGVMYWECGAIHPKYLGNLTTALYI